MAMAVGEIDDDLFPNGLPIVVVPLFGDESSGWSDEVPPIPMDLKNTMSHENC